MTELSLTAEMIAVMIILAFTMYLFISEVVRVDVAALIIMVLLGLVSYAWPLLTDNPQGLVDITRLFSGFASNAVISIIAVMIIGAGLDKSGIMSKVAMKILQVGGTTEKRVIPMISGSVGFISSFMQNVGAAALFLPVVRRISDSTGLPMSRLLMPMGFCAILGGTVTMIGSSPLILLNDLILTSNHSLPTGVAKMQTFNLFDVTPIGLALVSTGIIYFVLAGRYVLPANTLKMGDELQNTLDYFKQTYGVDGSQFEVRVAEDSVLAGNTVENIETLAAHKLLIIASHSDGVLRVSPARDVQITAGAHLALLGTAEEVKAFCHSHQLSLKPKFDVFSEMLSHNKAGIAEIVIPPASHLVDKRLMEVRMRKTYGLNILAVFRGHEAIRAGFRDLVLQSGDTLVVYTRWDDLAELEKNRDFVVVTGDYPHEALRPHKMYFALGFFIMALSLVLFTDLRLSVALLAGALGMILSNVLTIDEAYESVSWKTVFLLASLIPLGMAVETTGTAAWIAQETLVLLGGVPSWVLQAAIAMLATFFTLVMSNVGATVLLVPLAVNIAIGAGADPRVFALTVAIATSNSFLIPTHQVNALIMGPAGYRVKDFVRAGGIMTVLFLVVALTMLNLVF